MTTGTSENSIKNFKRRLRGVVVSDVNDKTIVVDVQRRYKHPVYKKFMTKTKKYHAHDELNAAQVGDRVTIVEARPFSAKKRWELVQQQS